MASGARLPLSLDLVTVLESKAKALEVYDKHLREPGDDEEIVRLLHELRQDDERHVRLLKAVLLGRLDENIRVDDEDEMDVSELEALDEHYDEGEGLDAHGAHSEPGERSDRLTPRRT